ncbi:hypothetical protein [Streptomyces sp. NPDC003077]|uniref:hypothetical protein n=1 Tax=Streptomyces sp. NPDC003077 TaxID=3154443 RepID=UPI0033B39D76
MSLPGADELFRTTGGMALQPSSPRRGVNGSATADEPPRVPAPGGEPAPADQPEPETPPRQRPEAPASGDAPASAPAARAAEHAGRAAEPEAAKGRRRAERVESAAAPAAASQTAPARRRARAANRRPSGRERHDEKITVYVSAEELMDLEHARLVLRGEHGLAVDRGRIVREAVAVVLADLESRGDASILVRRLRGR